MLVRYAKAFPARGQDSDAGCPSQDGIRQLGGRVEQMLAVVEHDQQLAGP